MAESNCTTTDIVQVAMPFPKLVHCLDKLMYPKVVVIRKKINQNLATILSPFGTGHAGYLGIMVTKVQYAQCFNDPFKPPINSGKYPDNIPVNASAQ